MTTASAFLSLDVLGDAVAVIAAMILGLDAALARARWGGPERKTAVRWTAIVLSGWFALALILAGLDVYRSGVPGGIPTIQYAILVPVIAGVILLRRSKALWRALDVVPQAWIVGLQFYRVLGVTFLILYASGQLPGEFAWPAGAGDIAVGLLAPVVALAFARGPKTRGWMVALWNAVGITDLVVAVGTGTLTSPSRLQRMAFDHPNELIGVYPLVLIPTFLVPLALVLHLASLAKLRRSSASLGSGAIRPSSPSVAA
jgi:hypothetical protein